MRLSHAPLGGTETRSTALFIGLLRCIKRHVPGTKHVYSRYVLHGSLRLQLLRLRCKCMTAVSPPHLRINPDEGVKAQVIPVICNPNRPLGLFQQTANGSCHSIVRSKHLKIFTMSHSLCLGPNEGEAFFAFLKRERRWKTANIKLHGPVYCTPAYTTQKGVKLAVNFYTTHDFVDVVNRKPEHFDVGTQATFRELVKLYRQWCQSESSSDDEEQRNTVPERTPQQKAPEELSKQDEAQREQDPDDDISDTEDGTSQSTAASECAATLTPQSAEQPPKKRGHIGSSTAANATRTQKKTPATSRGAGFVPRSPPRTTGPTIGRATRASSSQQNVSKSAPRQRGRKPSAAPASSAVSSSESLASCSSLVDAAKHLQKALADAKEEYKKLKRYQKVLGRPMSIKVKDLFDVLQAYDAKLELSIDEYRSSHRRENCGGCCSSSSSCGSCSLILSSRAKLDRASFKVSPSSSFPTSGDKNPVRIK